MPINIKTALFRKISSDQAFIVSELRQVQSGRTLNLHMENPSDSERDFWIVTILTSSEDNFISVVYDDFDGEVTEGEDVEIQSLLLDEDSDDNDGSAEFLLNMDFTPMSIHAVGASNGGVINIGGTENSVSAAMEPSREIVVEVKNTSDSASFCGISVIYFEKRR